MMEPEGYCTPDTILDWLCNQRKTPNLSEEELFGLKIDHFNKQYRKKAYARTAKSGGSYRGITRSADGAWLRASTKQTSSASIGPAIEISKPSAQKSSSKSTRTRSSVRSGKKRSPVNNLPHKKCYLCGMTGLQRINSHWGKCYSCGMFTDLTK